MTISTMRVMESHPTNPDLYNISFADVVFSSPDNKWYWRLTTSASAKAGGPFDTLGDARNDALAQIGGSEWED